MASTGGTDARSIRVICLCLEASGGLDVGIRSLGPASAIATGAGRALGDLFRGECPDGAQGAHGIGLDLLGGRERR